MWWFGLLCLVSKVHAMSGNDVYNNLFSDLSPLIALFGEQVSKQFLSQSLTFADCILFAMAPLGILTGVVSAIRIGGFAWMRAVIGRSTENRGAAGLELTSATSPGICELWDGKNVVRLLGNPSIMTVVFVRRQSKPPEIEAKKSEEGEKEPLLEEVPEVTKRQETLPMVVDFETAKSMHWIESTEVLAARERAAETNKMSEKKRARRGKATGGQQDDFGDQNNSSIEVRNPIPTIPPNIALNSNTRPSPVVTGVTVSFAVLVQSSVLVIGGLLTYRISEPPSRYAFPLMAIGTILVSIGMTICSYTVVSSSQKELWACTPGTYTTEAPKVAWIQRRQVVSDESFQPYAIYPQQNEIALSLAGEADTSEHPFIVSLGVIASLVGFILQFVGLRNLHWGVSVAQLVAMFLVTALRVLIRLPLVPSTRCQELQPNFELEWFAHYVLGDSLIFWPQLPRTVIGSGSGESQIESLVRIRMDLGKMSEHIGWNSTFTDEAILLKDTLDAVLTYVFTEEATKVFVAHQNISEFEWNLEFPALPSKTATNQRSQFLPLKATRFKRPGQWSPWNSDLASIEAVLALLLCQVLDGSGSTGSDAEDFDIADQQPHNIRGPCIWHLCPSSAQACMDFDWWICRSSGFVEQTTVIDRSTTCLWKDENGMWNCRAPQCETGTLRPQTTLSLYTRCSLARLCSRYIFSIFLPQLLRKVEHLRGETKITLTPKDSVPEILRFQHSSIERLANAISNQYLFGRSEVYSVLVPALRLADLLPDPLNVMGTLDEDHIVDPDQQLKIATHTYLRNGRSFLRKSLWDNATNTFTKLALLDVPERSRESIQILSRKFLGLIASWKASNLVPSSDFVQDLQFTDMSDLWHLDMKLLSMTNGKAEPDWLEDVLIDAIKQERYTHVMLILLELLDGQVGKQFRGKLGHWYRYAVLIKDTSILEALLFHSLKPSGRDPSFGSALVLASETANIKALTLLIQHGVSPDTIAGDGNSALLAATSLGNIDTVRILLEHGAHPDPVAVPQRSTPIAAAARLPDPSILQLLLGAGASANPPARTQGTPLQLAALSGLLSNIQILMKHGADPHWPAPRNGRTALQAAVESGDISCIDYLLDQGCNMNEPPGLEGFTSLQIACRQGNFELVERFLDLGAEVNAPSSPTLGLTALQAAVLGNHSKVVKRLLEAGADVNAASSDGGYTALAAAAYADIEVANILLNSGTIINSPIREHGRTALQAASETGNLDVLRRLLKEDGIDVNEAPAIKEGRTSLQAAAGRHHVEAVKILLEKGADIDASGAICKGRTALQAAAETGDMQIVHFLIDSGANVNAPPSEDRGYTALQAACNQGHIEMVQYLCSRGANIDAFPCIKGGRTALQAAAEAGDLAVVKYLLKEGAYINEHPASIDGITAWKAAFDGDHQDVLSLLEERGAYALFEDVLGDEEFLEGWTSVYHYDPNPWSEGTRMERGSCNNGAPDIPYYEIRHRIQMHSAATRAIDEWTPLQMVARIGDEILVQEVLKAGADINEKPCLLGGRTALQAAAEEGHDALVLQLIAAGSDVNAPAAKINGMTALELASGEGHLAVVRILLVAGVQHEQSAELENPPALWLAAAGGHLAVVKELIEAGDAADVHHGGLDGRSAIEVARDNRFPYIVEELTSRVPEPA